MYYETIYSTDNIDTVKQSRMWTIVVLYTNPFHNECDTFVSLKLLISICAQKGSDNDLTNLIKS